MALKRWRIRRRLLAGRDAWRQMDVRITPLTRWQHIGLCVVAVAVAYGLLALFGAHQPALKLLHRWFPAVALLAALLLAALLALVLRGWVGRSLLAVPAAALLSYAAAPLAFHLYFAVTQTARWSSSIAATGLWKSFVLTVVVWPSFTFAWLFAALAGGLYLVTATLVEGAGLVLIKRWLAGLRRS